MRARIIFKIAVIVERRLGVHSAPLRRLSLFIEGKFLSGISELTACEQALGLR